MVIYDYNDAEISPKIRRIKGDELSLVQRIADLGSECDAVFRGTYNGMDVALKLKYQGGSDFAGFLKVEANSIHTLQGVQAMPVLYGIVESETISLADEKFEVGLGIVIEYVRGQPIMDVSEYVNKETARDYHTKTGINVHGSVGRQLAQYLRESMERRLVDTDLPERDIFLDVNDSEVRITKIDQGHVKNRRDIDAGIDFEVYDHKYENAMKWLLALPMVDVSHGFREYLVLPSSNEKDYLEGATRYRRNGLASFAELIESYARREFDTDTFQRRFPDDDTFLQFLDRWKKVMEDFGKFFISQP